MQRTAPYLGGLTILYTVVECPTYTVPEYVNNKAEGHGRLLFRAYVGVNKIALAKENVVQTIARIGISLSRRIAPNSAMR